MKTVSAFRFWVSFTTTQALLWAGVFPEMAKAYTVSEAESFMRSQGLVKKAPKNFLQVYDSLAPALDERDRIILGNLRSRYHAVDLASLEMQKISTGGKTTLRLTKKARSDGSAVEIVEEGQDIAYVKIVGQVNKKTFTYRIYPQELDLPQVVEYFSRVDKGFRSQMVNPVTPLRLLSPEQVKKLSRKDATEYFKRLSAVITAAEKVSASIRTKSDKKTSWLPWPLELESAYAAGSASGEVACVVGGWSGTLQGQNCHVTDEQSRGSCPVGRVNCNPLIYGKSSTCVGLGEGGRCSEASSWDQTFRFYLDLPANSIWQKNFHDIKQRLSGNIGNLVDICRSSLSPGAGTALHGSLFNEAVAAGPEKFPSPPSGREPLIVPIDPPESAATPDNPPRG
ncbi:MAG: hypothetical protein N2Z70_06635, partial [Bdellovibrionaceae bacterium]|nr:hypothetical protein [Pseudobdellovibrionaceae bacterium]